MGQEIGNLTKIVMSAFGRSDLDRVLLYNLDIRMDLISNTSSLYPTQVVDILFYLIQNNRIGDFIDAIVKERPLRDDVKVAAAHWRQLIANGLVVKQADTPVLGTGAARRPGSTPGEATLPTMAPAIETEVQVFRYYRHFKGGLYYTFMVGKHSETGEGMVAYASWSKPNEYWFRPAKMFLSEVEHGGYLVSRFKLIAEREFIPEAQSLQPKFPNG